MPKLTKSQLALRRAYPKRKRVVPVIKTLKKQVQHLMRVDRNQIYTDDDAATALPTTTGLVTYLNTKLQEYCFGAANDVNTQAYVLGKSITLSIDLTFQVNSSCRIILFKDTASDNTLPSVNLILRNANTAAGTTILSGRNIDFVQRFKVLYDRTHHFLTSQDTGTTGTRANKIIKIHKVFKDLKMEYNATGGGPSVANCVKNQLFMLQISSNANATAGTYVSRVVFEPPKASQ